MPSLKSACLRFGEKGLLPVPATANTLVAQSFALPVVEDDDLRVRAAEQNLMTQYHLRYGGRGVMIYWHVEKNSTCIYSQLKTCSSSEVAAMINGVLKHCTSMEVQKNYVDSHGQSEVAFAFTHLLGFQLMPRLKRIKVQKLYRPYAGVANAYPNLEPVMTRPINWDLIRQQYDQMVKYGVQPTYVQNRT
jgi:TnpA family transposase